MKSYINGCSKPILDVRKSLLSLQNIDLTKERNVSMAARLCFLNVCVCVYMCV